MTIEQDLTADIFKMIMRIQSLGMGFSIADIVMLCDNGGNANNEQLLENLEKYYKENKTN